jgi:hypothetical protein
MKELDLGNFKSVKNFYTKNQFIIEMEKGIIFQSYNSIIVVQTKNKTYLNKEFWDYSKTTGKYRNLFLKETKEVIKKKIESGLYQLIDLD